MAKKENKIKLERNICKKCGKKLEIYRILRVYDDKKRITCGNCGKEQFLYPEIKKKEVKT